MGQEQGGEQAATEQPQRIIDDPLLAALVEDIPKITGGARSEENNEPPDIKRVADEPPADTQNPADQKAATNDASGGAIKATVKQRPDIAVEIERAFARHMPQKRTPEPPAPTASNSPQPGSDDLDLSGFVDAQIEELEDAAFAEESDPKKKGLRKRLHDFYRSVDKWVEERKEDPDRTFDENDEEFTKFLESNKPKWEPGERDRIRKDRLVKAAKQEALKELAPQLEEAKRVAMEAKALPSIEKRVLDVGSEIQKAASDDPLEQEVYGRIKDSATTLVSEWLRLSEGIDDIRNPKNEDQASRHRWLMEFVGQQSALFDKHGGQAKVRNGRSFLTPVEYANAISSGKDVSGNWTFGPQDVVTMIKTHAIESAKSQVKAEEDAAAKRGFVRARTTSHAKTAEEPKPVDGIRASTSAAPGAALDGKTADLPHPGKEIINILGLR